MGEKGVHERFALLKVEQVLACLKRVAPCQARAPATRWKHSVVIADASCEKGTPGGGSVDAMQ